MCINACCLIKDKDADCLGHVCGSDDCDCSCQFRTLPVQDHATAYHSLGATLMCNPTPCLQSHAKLASPLHGTILKKKYVLDFDSTFNVVRTYEQTQATRSAMLCCMLFCRSLPSVLVRSGGCRERKWKIAQAKRFAKLVSKSNLDVEGRERARRKEELLNLKKRAAWIAKEVTVLITTAMTVVMVTVWIW